MFNYKRVCRFGGFLKLGYPLVIHFDGIVQYSNSYVTNCQSWFGVWNIRIIFPFAWNIIIKIDELIFFRCFVNHQPVSISSQCRFRRIAKHDSNMKMLEFAWKMWKHLGRLGFHHQTCDFVTKKIKDFKGFNHRMEMGS